VTFHYAIVHPAKAEAEQEEIKLALARAIEQGIEGKITITDESFGGVRFKFADEGRSNGCRTSTPRRARSRSRNCGRQASRSRASCSTRSGSTSLRWLTGW
jgi:hypothetical protein